MRLLKLLTLWKPFGHRRAITLVVPGAEYVLGRERTHYGLEGNRLHFALGYERMHYELREEHDRDNA